MNKRWKRWIVCLLCLLMLTPAVGEETPAPTATVFYEETAEPTASPSAAPEEMSENSPVPSESPSAAAEVTSSPEVTLEPTMEASPETVNTQSAVPSPEPSESPDPKPAELPEEEETVLPSPSPETEISPASEGLPAVLTVSRSGSVPEQEAPGTLYELQAGDSIFDSTTASDPVYVHGADAENLTVYLSPCDDFFDCVYLLDGSFFGYLSKGGVSAPEDCEHTQTYVRQTRQDLGFYEKYDDDTCRTGYYFQLDTVCVSCGAVVNTENSETKYQYRVHDTFGGDACGYCGAAAAGCQHPQTQIFELEQVTSYEFGDAASHWKVYSLLKQTVCKECGNTIEEETLEAELKKSEPHEFVSADGENAVMCQFCSHEASCPHENTQSEDHEAFLSASYADADKHWAAYDVYQTTLCLDCGAQLKDEWAENGNRVLEPHDFSSDGACLLCGMQCAHADGKTTVYQKETAGCVSISADQHKTEYNVRKVTLCAECGYVFEEEAIRTDSEEAAHVYQDGRLCTACGYDREISAHTCSHQNTEKTEVNEALWSDRKTVSVDADVHRYTYVCIVSRTLCKDCGKLLNEEKEEKTADAPHSFEEGICSQCGYETSCAHRNTYTAASIQSNLRSYQRKDASEHTYVYDLIAPILCEDCGMRVGESTLQSELSAAESHQFSNYRCVNCKEPAPLCLHEESETASRTVFCEITEKNEQTHTCLEQIDPTYKTCSSCGAVLNSSEGFIRETEEEHSFENGRCIVCGWKTESGNVPGELFVLPENAEVFWETKDTAPFYVHADGSEMTLYREDYDENFYILYSLDGAFFGYLPKEKKPDTEEPAPEEPADRPTEAPEAPSFPFVPEITTPSVSPSPSVRVTAAPRPAVSLETLTKTAARELSLLAREHASKALWIADAEKIFTPEEYECLLQLSLPEQAAVILSVLGYPETAERLLKELELSASEEMTNLMEKIQTRLAALPAEETDAFVMLLKMLFPEKEVEIEGVACRTVSIVIEIVRENETERKPVILYVNEEE